MKSIDRRSSTPPFITQAIRKKKTVKRILEYIHLCKMLEGLMNARDNQTSLVQLCKYMPNKPADSIIKSFQLHIYYISSSLLTIDRSIMKLSKR